MEDNNVEQLLVMYKNLYASALNIHNVAAKKSSIYRENNITGYDCDIYEDLEIETLLLCNTIIDKINKIISDNELDYELVEKYKVHRRNHYSLKLNYDELEYEMILLYEKYIEAMKQENLNRMMVSKPDRFKIVDVKSNIINNVTKTLLYFDGTLLSVCAAESLDARALYILAAFFGTSFVASWIKVVNEVLEYKGYTR